MQIWTKTLFTFHNCVISCVSLSFFANMNTKTKFGMFLECICALSRDVLTVQRSFIDTSPTVEYFFDLTIAVEPNHGKNILTTVILPNVSINLNLKCCWKTLTNLKLSVLLESLPWLADTWRKSRGVLGDLRWDCCHWPLWFLWAVLAGSASVHCAPCAAA